MGTGIPTESIGDKLRFLLDATPALMHCSRPDGYFDSFNSRWLEYVGKPLEDLLGWSWASVIHPKDAGDFFAEWRVSLASGKPLERQARIRRSDGEYRWFLARFAPQRDELGRVVRWCGLLVDIDSLKSVEAEAQMLIDAIPQQIWSAAPDGANDSVNERWQSEMGRTKDETRGDGWLAILHPEDRDRVVKAWREAVSNGTAYEQEERHRGPDGTYRWYLNRGIPWRDSEGRIIKWYGTNTDIAACKEAEENVRRLSGQLLRSQDEERRRIARDLHDSTGQDLVALATMLGQVLGSLPSKERGPRGLLLEMKDVTDRCMNEIRTLAYMLYPPSLDVSGLTDAIRDYANGFSKRTGIRVEFDLAPDLGRFGHDAELAMFRVVQEALTNVQRHSGSREVTIRTHRNADVTLDISDLGHGIVAAAGVGIRSMEERVKLIGGRLEIESTMGGTTVRVILPLRGPIF